MYSIGWVNLCVCVCVCVCIHHMSVCVCVRVYEAMMWMEWAEFHLKVALLISYNLYVYPNSLSEQNMGILLCPSDPKTKAIASLKGDQLQAEREIQQKIAPKKDISTNLTKFACLTHMNLEGKVQKEILFPSTIRSTDLLSSRRFCSLAIKKNWAYKPDNHGS